MVSVQASVGSSPKSRLCAARETSSAATTPAHNPIDHHAHDLREHHGDDLWSSGAERDAQTDLRTASSDAVRRHAIGADGGEDNASRPNDVESVATSRSRRIDSRTASGSASKRIVAPGLASARWQPQSGAARPPPASSGSRSGGRVKQRQGSTVTKVRCPAHAACRESAERLPADLVLRVLGEADNLQRCVRLSSVAG